MSQKNILTFACPVAVLNTKPGKVLNAAEENFVRLIYDSFISRYGLAGDITPENDGQVFELSRISRRKYADSTAYGPDEWAENLRHAIRDVSTSGEVRQVNGTIQVTGVDSAGIEDALRSATAIPFRPAPDGTDMSLDTHPATSGPYQVEVARPGAVFLKANRNHVADPMIHQVRVLQITDPSELRRRFARSEIDIMVVGGDETDLYEGTAPGLAEGTVRSAPSTTISMLSVRPHSILADDDLRMLIASSIPRDEFALKYLGANGCPSYGFSSAVRSDKSAVPFTSSRVKSSRKVVFIVPPSERNIARGRWLAQKITDRCGVDFEIKVPTWPEYWTALHNPGIGDLVWAGIKVDEDLLRYWVRYNLFGPWLPIPEHFAKRKSTVWSPGVTNLELEESERQLVGEGWIIPLYHHYQSYLVRNGLQGFTLDGWDWPLPATRRIADLSWH